MERKQFGSPHLCRLSALHGPGALRHTDYLVPYTSSLVSVMNDVLERYCRTMRRPTCRSLAVLGFGVVATVPLSGRVDELWLALLWGLVIGAAYFPLARVRCPACGRFPFRGVINIGGLPLLCFWPDQ